MIKPTPLADVSAKNGVFILIYGQPGGGKTASIRGFPKDRTAIICSEPQGLVTLERMGWKDAKVILPKTFDEFVSAVEECLADGTIDYIFADTLSQSYDGLMKSYTEGKDLSKIGIDAYRYCGLQFQRIFRRLLDGLAMGKTIIATVHLKYREEREGDSIKNIREPDLPGQLPQFVGRIASLVLRADHVKAGKDVKYILMRDDGEGGYGKDIWNVMGDGIKENDLWAILQPVLSSKKAQDNGANEKATYAKLLKIANSYNVRKPEVDAFLRRISFDMSKHDANWQEAIDQWEKENRPF